MSDRERVLPTHGLAAPPRANGELLFEAPWEGRLFGVTLALLEAGRFEWSEFQARLIEAIAAHEAELTEVEEGGYRYYDCWLQAFQGLATDKGWLDTATLEALERDLEARPPGHDHPGSPVDPQP
jgi:nitrile hydratase accessory protein